MATTIKRLGIDQITAASELQARETLSEDAIADYAAIYGASNGTSALPPIRVVWDQSTETYWLVDGWHRLYGAKRAKVAKLSCEVVNGTKTFAILEACGANDEHGVRRTNADKRKAVRMLLENPDWASKPDRWIAEHARVSHPFVATVRGSVQLETLPVEQEKRTAPKDGKSRPASKAKATEQREAVAEAIEANPDATVREIAEETGASVGTVQSVKSSAASIVLDALEIPVPADLREHHELRITLAKVGRELDKYRQRAKELAEQPGGEWLRLQDIDAGIRALKGHFQDAGYHTVCPSCKGAKRKNCQKCHGRAFVPEYMKGMVTT